MKRFNKLCRCCLFLDFPKEVDFYVKGSTIHTDGKDWLSSEDKCYQADDSKIYFDAAVGRKVFISSNILNINSYFIIPDQSTLDLSNIIST